MQLAVSRVALEFLLTVSALEMATFEPIPYTYIPTAPRSKSRAARSKITSKQFSVGKNLRIEPRSVALNVLQPSTGAMARAAADDDADGRARIRGMSAIVCATATVTNPWGLWSGAGAVYNGNGVESDDDYFPTIEELLFTKLWKEGFVTEDGSRDNTDQGVEEVASEERSGSVDHSRSASGDGSGGSRGERVHYPPSWIRTPLF